MKSAISKSLMGTLLLSASITTHASTYAVSTTSVDNFLLTGASVTGWTFSQVMATSDGVTEAFADNSDPAAACVGCGYNNSFVSHGSSTSPYSYSDALISDSDITTASGGSASAIAEVYAANGVNGSGLASNSMTALITATNSTITVSFDISSYLKVTVTNGDIGFASRSMEVTLSDMSNAVIGSISPFDLGIGPNDALDNLNQTGNVFNFTGLTSGFQYKLNISMDQQVFSNVQPVPVPAAAWLFGSGLMGLVAVARRRKTA